MPSPLQHRLPVPPALFVGCSGELAWLRVALGRGAVAVVVGSAGAGKTALVSQACRDTQPAAYVRAPAGGKGALARELARAMRGHCDGSSTWEQDDLTAAIEVAERAGLTVVIDDLHRSTPTEARKLLRLVHAHCRRSKWIASSRLDPMCREIAAQTLALGPLADSDLGNLAHHAMPELADEDVNALVARANGSPARRGRASDLRLRSARPPDPRQLDTLPGSAAAFLRALDIFAIPVGLDVVAALAQPPDADAIDLLVDRGFVVAEAGRYAITDLARVAGAAIHDAAPNNDALIEAATGLGADADADARLEAIRLLLLAGDDTGARSLVDAVGDELITTGRAQPLHMVLHDCEDDASIRWKLHCAVTTGDPHALAAARAPRDGALADRYRWACALRLRGDLVGAADVAAALEAEAADAGDVELAFEAGLLRARSLAAHGTEHANQALALLGALVPPTKACAVRRDARVAVIESRMGDTEKALAMVDAVRGKLHVLGRRQRTEVAGWLASIVGRVGRLVDAERIVDRALSQADRHDAATLDLMYLSSGLALKRAAYQRAQAIVSELERMGEGTSTRLRRHVATLAGFRAIAQGEYAGIEEKLSEEAFAARQDDLPIVYGRLGALVFFVRTNCATPLTTVAPPDRDVLAGHPFGELLRLRRLARIGELPADARRPRPEDYRNLEARVVAGLVAAEMGVLAGELDSSLDTLAAALDTAQRYGYQSWEFAIRQLLCEALLIVGDIERAAQCSRELVAVAERADSRYHRLEASLIEMACTSRAPVPATLEELAGAIDIAPTASRRARMLLGGAARSDRLDSLVLEALRRRPGWAEVSLVRAEPSEPTKAFWHTGWGLDEYREQVWLPSGRTIDFSRWPVLWALLRALAERSESASKEYLVRTVWSEAEYHPLRHDNRLQAAVRKLRHAIEDDASRPERVVTTADGYRLGGIARRMKRSSTTD